MTVLNTSYSHPITNSTHEAMHAGKDVTFRIHPLMGIYSPHQVYRVSDYPAFVTIGQLPDVFNGHCSEIAIYAASCCCSSSTSCSCVDICNTNTSNGCTVTGCVTSWWSCRNSRQFNLSVRIGRFSWPLLRELKVKKGWLFAVVFDILASCSYSYKI